MRFTKLHATIVASSIWAESPQTCKVWITMLALADWDGMVAASVDGLAHLARVSIEECQTALAKLAGPDPYSRDGTTGERIEKVVGGWLILNHNRYRDMRTSKQVKHANYMRDWRARETCEVHKPHSEKCEPHTSISSLSENSKSSKKEREHEGEEPPKKPKKPKSDAVERPVEVSQEHWDGWIAARRKKRAIDPTNLVMKAMRREAEKAGISLDDAVRIAAEKGWQAFDASWYSGSSGSRPGAKQSIFNAPLMQPDPEDTSNMWTEEDERQDQENLRRLVSKMTPEKRAKWEAEQIAQGCEVYRGDWPPERLAAWEAERLARGQKIWRDGR